MNENETYTNYEFTGENGAAGGGYPYGQQYAAPQKPEKRGKKRGAGLKTVALALSCSLLGGMAGAALVRGGTAGTTTLTESSRVPAAVEVAYQSSDKLMTAAEVYAANVNATVGVTTSVTTTNYFGFRTSTPAAGSGFILSADGYIVTNYHVVEDSDSITVTTYDGKTYDAALVGWDESNDVAVLKIDAAGLTPVVLGSSDSLQVGEDVVAIGNPLGELTFSLTKGSVSALDREVTLSSGVTMNLIQTDAAINAGNSGGALFNLYGEVVGITNAKYSSSGSGEASVDNIGFAIPLDSVKTIITDLIEKGYVSHPYVGVNLKDAADAALIFSVEAGSPAEKAGLKANDIVTAANGEKIASADDLTEAVQALSAGDSLTLTVTRGGEETEIAVTVGEKPQTTDREQTGGQSRDGYGGYEGYEDYEGYEGYGFPFSFPFSFGESGGYARG